MLNAEESTNVFSQNELCPETLYTDETSNDKPEVIEKANGDTINTDSEIVTDTDDNEVKPKQVKEMIESLESELTEERSKNKISTNEIQKYNKLLQDLKNDLKVKLDNSKKQTDEARKEKESMVLKYAQSEQKSLDLFKKIKEYELRLKDTKSSLDSVTNDRDRLNRELKLRVSDFSSYERELNNLKASITIAEQKLKNEENKYKEELENHKLFKKRYDEAQKNLTVLREENITLRSNCQEMIKTYQNSEEMRSNSLTVSLRQLQDEVKTLSESKEKISVELTSLRSMNQSQGQELKVGRDRMKMLEADKLCQDQSIKQLKDSIRSLSLVKEEQAGKIRQMNPLQEEMDALRVDNKRLKDSQADLQKSLEENAAILEQLHQKESELLVFTQNLSDKNAGLQSELASVRASEDSARQQLVRTEQAYKEAAIKTNYWEQQFGEGSTLWQKEREEFQNEIAALHSELALVSEQLGDARDQVTSLQRRHKAHIKDLTRQLAKETALLQATASTTALSSETSSKTQLLDGVASTHSVCHSDESSLPDESSTYGQSLANGGIHRGTSTNTDSSNHGCHLKAQYQALSNTPEIQLIEPHSQALIDKIGRLQRQNARLLEKIDFLSEHANQLTQEIQKKSSIVRHLYSQSEERGSMRPEGADRNHWMMARRGHSIMASVFSSRPADQHLTLELALEISNRLQCVLEDTTAKNITLKDSVNTLGEEISRLSNENSKLKHQLKPSQ